jgi:diguanylate cyclase (GGDEF)-like protein/PAS domain S-box-containing protein
MQLHRQRQSIRTYRRPHRAEFDVVMATRVFAPARSDARGITGHGGVFARATIGKPRVFVGQLHLEEIVEASTDYVATTDVDGRILYANAAFRKRFGIETVDDFESTNHNLFSFYSPASRDLFFQEGLAQLWSTGRWSGEIEGVDSDGTTIPMWQAAIAHLDANGHPQYFSGIARDITEMKQTETDLRQSEERFRALIANGSDAILVLSAEGTVKYASPALERLLGYPLTSLIGTTAFDLIHPDDLEVAMNSFIAAFTGQNSPNGLQYRVRHHDGSWRWTESITTNHLETPGVNGFIVNARDITARHDANDRIAQASELLASVMGAAANEAIFVTDRDARIVAFSRGAEVLLGHSADEVLAAVHPSQFHLQAEIEAVAEELGVTPEQVFLHAPEDGQPIVRHWVFVRRDGTTFDGELTICPRYDSSHTLCGFLYVARDVTERRRNEAALTLQARHDSLTGLANRVSLNAALDAAAGDTTWDVPGRTLLFIDLDHFKQVNDTLGHAAGDSVLRGVATRLIDNLRQGDLAVRLGGDEFVVLLAPGATCAMGSEIANRIVHAIGQPFQTDELDEVLIGASVGIAVSTAHTLPADLLAAADQAAYIAKRSGRGQAVIAEVNT